MSIKWSDLHFKPNDETIQQIVSSWAWLLPESFTPILFSIMGDMFFQSDSSEVLWLNTGTGEITPVANSVDHFNELLNSEIADEWLMPYLVEQLHEARKIPNEDQCYTYVTLPVFAEGKYTIENLNAVPAREHFAITGHILKQIQELKDGSQVKIVITD
ncbi:T6SS immunity protein Tdi1 domain-containing protein [Aquirhabdus sp.]|uniref:T6SS immunity protein Tdi1 domain-containing protein n=1 Tax=Aquirhabdus sp. TaxID=2824160 RepID=UPI00396C5909